MKLGSARKVLVGAVALYLLWVAALAILAVVSGSRPSAGKIGSATDSRLPAADSEQPND